MKKKFSKFWKASKQPRKKRKYLANAPLHIKRKFLRVNLSKELREKIGQRNIGIRKGDKIKILRGKNKGKSGKIIIADTKKIRVYVEGIQIKKQDGSKINIPLKPSNLQIIELNEEDKKRFKKIPKKETTKKADSKELNKEIKQKIENKKK